MIARNSWKLAESLPESKMQPAGCGPEGSFIPLRMSLTNALSASSRFDAGSVCMFKLSCSQGSERKKMKYMILQGGF
jgi:hypothetical protein